MKPLRILVSDSYHTETIVKNLNTHLKDKATIYADNPPKEVKVDVLILSGFNVQNAGPQALKNLKEQIGAEDVLIVITSASAGILEEISRNPAYSADFLIPKSEL